MSAIDALLGLNSTTASAMDPASLAGVHSSDDLQPAPPPADDSDLQPAPPPADEPAHAPVPTATLASASAAKPQPPPPQQLSQISVSAATVLFDTASPPAAPVPPVPATTSSSSSSAAAAAGAAASASMPIARPSSTRPEPRAALVPSTSSISSLSNNSGLGSVASAAARASANESFRLIVPYPTPVPTASPLPVASAAPLPPAPAHPAPPAPAPSSHAASSSSSSSSAAAAAGGAAMLSYQPAAYSHFGFNHMGFAPKPYVPPPAPTPIPQPPVPERTPNFSPAPFLAAATAAAPPPAAAAAGPRYQQQSIAAALAAVASNNKRRYDDVSEGAAAVSAAAAAIGAAGRPSAAMRTKRLRIPGPAGRERSMPGSNANNAAPVNYVSDDDEADDFKKVPWLQAASALGVEMSANRPTQDIIQMAEALRSTQKAQYDQYCQQKEQAQQQHQPPPPLVYPPAYDCYIHNTEWIAQHWREQRVPSCVFLLKSIGTVEHERDAVLADPWGEIHCSVADGIPDQIRESMVPGAVLILQKVAIFSPTTTSHVLILMPSCILNVIAPAQPIAATQATAPAH